MLTQQRTPLKKNKDVQKAATIIGECHDVIESTMKDAKEENNLPLILHFILECATFTSFWDKLWCNQASVATLSKTARYPKPFKVHPFIPSFYGIFGLTFFTCYKEAKKNPLETKERDAFLYQAAFFGNFKALFIIVNQNIAQLRKAREDKTEISTDFLKKLFILLNDFADYYTVPALILKAFAHLELYCYYLDRDTITKDSKITRNELPSEALSAEEQGMLSLHVAKYIQTVKAPICSPIIHNLLGRHENFSSHLATGLSRAPFLSDPLATLISERKSEFTPSLHVIEQEAERITRPKTFTPGAVRFY